MQAEVYQQDKSFFKTFGLVFGILAVFCMQTAAAAGSDATPAVSVSAAPGFSEISFADLKRLAETAKPELWRAAREENREVKLYLHWTAMPYGKLYDSYHITIDADGKLYLSGKSLSEIRPHTYMRNRGAVGITITGCQAAVPKALGAQPPTAPQVETMAQVIAILAEVLDIPIDLEHVMTHGEAGDNMDGLFPPYENNGVPYGMYGPFHTMERWDLAVLADDERWGSGGFTLRTKANRYQIAFRYGKWRIDG